VKRLIHNLFPPRRRPLTVGAAAPLAAFLATFAAVCVWLEWRDVVLFAAPRAFLLLAALPWIWWLHVTGYSGLTGLRSVLALLTRFLVVSLFAMLLADPRAVRKSDVLSVIYALDMSDSVGETASDEALSYITRTASEKPAKDEAGLVVFGRDAGVELPPRITFPFEAVNCRLARDGTSLQKALSLAAAMLPEENDGRVVLITDGVQTEGNYSSVLDELNTRDIPVDVLPIQYNYEREVWLEKLELPRFVKMGETYEASIILSSLTSGAGTLVLLENGKAICEQTVQFKAGKNRYVLPLYLRTPGYYEYVATIDLPRGHDGWAENNTAINYIYLKGEGRILLVTDPDGDERDWRPLRDALVEAQRVVDVQVAYELPRAPLSLMPYDCIAFVNAPADAFDIVQQNALREAIRSQGAGFLMVGGKNSFGPGGYHRSPVEEALPVTMDISQKKVLPKGALAIILHTCEFPEGNTWGKRVAKEALRVLGAQDEVGALAYDYQGGEKWLFPLTPAGEYERLLKIINNAQIGDMPSFANTMKMGLQALKKSDAAAKHMIIISDGDPAPPTPDVVRDFVASKISVSMVAVFPHGGQDISIMRSIAATTGGRYYFPQDPNLLPSIFIKEAKTLKRSMIQNKVFLPTIEFPSPILKGLGSLPELRGYVLTTPKARATTILKGPETEEIDPVLATWRFGLGKTAAFTSDLSPNWGAAWVNWEHYVAFVKQLVTDISRVERKTSLHMTAFAAGTSGVVVIEDHHETDSFLDIETRVSGPREKTEAIRLRQTGPRRYEGVFELWGKGRYRVMAAGAGDGRSEKAVGGFVVPYSPEYLRFRSSPIVLEDIARRTGGRILGGDEKGEEIFPKERRARASSKSIAHLFLILLACLIPIDVGVRRIQLDLQVIRGWLGLDRRKYASDETLSALLKRKKTIRFAPQDEGERQPEVRRGGRPAPLPAPTPADGAAAKAPAAAKPEKREEPKDEGRPMTTTERLLARKRKWQDEEE